MRWLSQRDLDAEAPLRLFAFPHAGSGAAGFYRWKRLLAPLIAVCPVLLPGRESRFAEPSMTSATDIIAALRSELPLDKPYVLYGHSMGSLLASECARALPRTGLQAPRALLVSGRNAPETSAVSHGMLHALSDSALTEALRIRYGTHGTELLDDPELRALFLPVVRADLQVAESYRPVPVEPLQCPVHAFAGRHDSSVTIQGLQAWASTTTAAFTAERLPGDHFFHFGEGQAALLDAIRGLIC